MTGVEIAAHVSEAGGASPLPTGPVETAGSFSEALAAQTDEERPVLIAGFRPDHSPFTVGDSGEEPSESALELTEATGVIPEVDVSLPLEGGAAHALLAVLVGDSSTDGEPKGVSPTRVVPAEADGIEGRGLSGQPHVVSSQVPAPVESVGPTANLQQKAVDVTVAQPEGAIGVPQTTTSEARLRISAGPAPTPRPGGFGSVSEIVKTPVPDTGQGHIPSPTIPGGDGFGQSTEAFVATNASAVDPDAGPHDQEIAAGRIANAATTTTSAAGETVVPSGEVARAQGSQDLKVFPRDGNAEPATPLRPVVVATPPTLTEPETPDGPSRPAQAADRVTSGDGKISHSAAPAATTSAAPTASTSEQDADILDTVLDEKIGLGRIFGHGAHVNRKTPQAVTVVGADRTTPIMVAIPGADGTSTHPVLSFPASIGVDAAVAEQVSVSIGMAPAEAWRYEEVARLLEDSGRVSQQSRASVAASAVMPLEALSDWTGAAVRSSFAPPVLSHSEQLELPDQLVRAIRMQWRNGIGDAKLRLTPENLGEVLVSLQVRQGSVSAVLRADSEIVRDWIKAHQDELKSSLEAQGLTLDELVVEEDGHADQQPGREFDHPRRRPPRQTSEARFEVRV